MYNLPIQKIFILLAYIFLLYLNLEIHWELPEWDKFPRDTCTWHRDGTKRNAWCRILEFQVLEESRRPVFYFKVPFFWKHTITQFHA
jgi:hypothetical protein